MTIDRLDDDKKSDTINLDRIIRSLNDSDRSIRQAAFHQLSKLDNDTAKQALWNYLPYDRMECLHTITDFNITDYNIPYELRDLPQYFEIADCSGQLVCYWSLTYKRAYLCCWDLVTGKTEKSCELGTHEFGLGQKGKVTIYTYQDSFSILNTSDIGDYNKPYLGTITDGFQANWLAFAVCPTDRTLLAIGHFSGNKAAGEIKVIDYETNTCHLHYEFEYQQLFYHPIHHKNRDVLDTVRPLLFTPDGKAVVAHFNPHRLESMLEVWCSETGELIKKIDGLSPLFLSDLAVHPDGTILACGLRDDKVCAWELLTDQMLFITSDAEPAPSILSPDGRILVYGTSTRDMVIWDLDKDRELYRLTGQTALLGSITISEDREFIAIYYTDHSIKIWGIPALEID